jgi:hypothetical protein
VSNVIGFRQLRSTGGKWRSVTKRTTSMAVILAGLLFVSACTDTSNERSIFDYAPSQSSPSVGQGSSGATLNPDRPVTIGDGPNTARPSGDDKTGLDATDSICRQMKRDLDDAITETLRDLREAGMPSDMMPTRAELKKQLSGALRANGCAGF